MLCENWEVSLWPFSNISNAALPSKTVQQDVFPKQSFKQTGNVLQQKIEAFKDKSSNLNLFHKLGLTLQNIWLSFFSTCVYQKSGVHKMKWFWKNTFWKKFLQNLLCLFWDILSSLWSCDLPDQLTSPLDWKWRHRKLLLSIRICIRSFFSKKAIPLSSAFQGFWA